MRHSTVMSQQEREFHEREFWRERISTIAAYALWAGSLPVGYFFGVWWMAGMVGVASWILLYDQVIREPPLPPKDDADTDA